MPERLLEACAVWDRALALAQAAEPIRAVVGEAVHPGTCSDLITSAALLDYIAAFDWDYVRIAGLSC